MVWNKKRLECLEKGITENSFSVNELIVKMFLVKKYYRLGNPISEEKNYVYRIDRNIDIILESLCEIEEVTLENMGLSYKILKQGDKIKFYLGAPLIEFIQEYEFKKFINS